MLSDTAIKNAKPRAVPFKLVAGKGLYLEIRPSGSKLWRYRYRIAGKENVFALGEYVAAPRGETETEADTRKIGGGYTLAEAGIERERCRRLVKQGIHPSHERKLDRIRATHENANTFRAVLAEWIEARGWADSTRGNRESQINMHLLPYLGDVPVRQITPSHVLEVLRRAASKESDTRDRKQGAKTRTIGGGTVVARLRQIISGVFDHAISTLRAEVNSAAPVRRAFKAGKTVHKTPLTKKQIGELMRALDNYSGGFMTEAALRLLWLTLARPSEVSGARWDEIDLDAATWKIPAARMKAREDHMMPLPVQAVALLQRVKAVSGDREHVFPHRDRRIEPMTYDALNKGIGRLGLAFHFTPHATRTTASTMLNEMGFRHDVIERQLAHQEKNAVRRAYNRADYLDERRGMMQQWADMVEAMATPEIKVVPGRFGKTA